MLKLEKVLKESCKNETFLQGADQEALRTLLLKAKPSSLVSSLVSLCYDNVKHGPGSTQKEADWNKKWEQAAEKLDSVCPYLQRLGL